MEEETKNLEGLGGWLILVGIGVLFGPFRHFSELVPMYNDIFTDGTWEMLTTPGNEGYHPLWSWLLMGEIITNSILFTLMLFAILLFFTKNRFFPKLWIGIIIFGTLFILFDALLVKLVLPNEPIFDPDTTKELARSVVGCLIWVPYMFVSKRVKATFTR